MTRNRIGAKSHHRCVPGSVNMRRVNPDSIFFFSSDKKEKMMWIRSPTCKKLKASVCHHGPTIPNALPRRAPSKNPNNRKMMRNAPIAPKV